LTPSCSSPTLSSSFYGSAPFARGIILPSPPIGQSRRKLETRLLVLSGAFPRLDKLSSSVKSSSFSPRRSREEAFSRERSESCRWSTLFRMVMRREVLTRLLSFPSPRNRLFSPFLFIFLPPKNPVRLSHADSERLPLLRKGGGIETGGIAASLLVSSFGIKLTLVVLPRICRRTYARSFSS